jgi:diguanylate cyclase (GGDEF)-like protein
LAFERPAGQYCGAKEEIVMSPSETSASSGSPGGGGSIADASGFTAAAMRDALLGFIDHADALLAVKEIATGRYLHVNARMAELLGRPAQQVVGLSDADMMEAGQWTALRAADQSAAAQPGFQQSEHRIERDGQRREFSVYRSVLAPSDGGAPRCLLCIWTELTAARQKDAQLQRALQQIETQQREGEAQRRETLDGNLRDAETGLYQRVHFEDQLRREVDLSSREHREFALVSITLDPLSAKALALGSAARLRVLEALGGLLRSNTRAMDASCRIDDDHFAVLLSGVGLATAHSRMEGLRRQCATQIVMLDGQEIGFTVSMGVSSFPHTALSQEELVRASATALAEARRRGGNHVTLASIRFESD